MKKQKILIYGLGKSGSLFAYELAKRKHFLTLTDIDDKKSNLAVDLMTVNKDVEFVKTDEIPLFEYDIVIIAISNPTIQLIREALTKTNNEGIVYIYSNLDDNLFNEVLAIKEDKIKLCGSTVNNKRYQIFYNKGNMLKGYHWREKPNWLRNIVKAIYDRYIKPYQYGAVYYAIEEIKKYKEV